MNTLIRVATAVASAAVMCGHGVSVAAIIEVSGEAQHNASDPIFSDQFFERVDVTTGSTFVQGIAASSGPDGTGGYISTTAYASADYETGALQVYAEKDVAAAQDVGRVAAAVAIFDDLVFAVDPLAASTEIGWAVRVDRTIMGDPFSTSLALQLLLRDSWGTSLGYAALTLSTTGSDLFTGTFQLPSDGIVSLEYRLAADIRRNVFAAESGLVDASDAAYLNFMLPDGVTFEGGASGFLSRAPVLIERPGTVNPVPLPASGALLLMGIGLLAAGRVARRSGRADAPGRCAQA